MKCKYIKSPNDLQTEASSIKQGFLQQALSKTGKADPFVLRAKEFEKAISGISNVEELLALEEYHDEIIAACGFSDKAKNQLSEKELLMAARKVLNEICKLSNNDISQELIYRYLLTKGDTLGGSMRNLTGAYASIRLIDCIEKQLKNNGKRYTLSRSKTGKAQSVVWASRVMLFDVKPKIIDKNIDVILLDAPNTNEDNRTLMETHSRYLACGELKGGIDPAGADEHWKTAISALNRIRTVFKSKSPELFFVAAAIEAAMAKEIFNQLNERKLSFAANLNNEDQLNDLAKWLISL